MHSDLLMLNVDIIVLFYIKTRNYLHLLCQGRVQLRPAPLPSCGGSGTGQAGMAEPLFQGSPGPWDAQHIFSCVIAVLLFSKVL